MFLIQHKHIPIPAQISLSQHKYVLIPAQICHYHSQMRPYSKTDSFLSQHRLVPTPTYTNTSLFQPIQIHPYFNLHKFVPISININTSLSNINASLSNINASYLNINASLSQHKYATIPVQICYYQSTNK